MKAFCGIMEDPKEIIPKLIYIRKVHFLDNCFILHELFRFINLNFKWQGKHTMRTFMPNYYIFFYLKLNRKVVIVFKKKKKTRAWL